VEEDDPNVFSTIELGYGAQVQLEDICALEEEWCRLRLLLLMMSKWISTMSTMLEVESTTMASAASATEELLEHVIHVHMLTPTWAASLLLLSDSFFSSLIVCPPLVGVRQGLVGQSDFLELRLGTVWILLVLVGVIFDGQLFEPFLDLSIISISAYSKHFIIVFTLIITTTASSISTILG